MKDNAKKEYADIIDMPHHQSSTRPHMSLYDRAAQFAPFAALSGFEDMVTEEARQTESEIYLSDNEIELINGVISEISSITGNGGHPTVSVTYFRPDTHKSGGHYEKLTGIIKKIDTLKKSLVFYGSDDINDRRIPTVIIPIERLTGIIINKDPE